MSNTNPNTPRKDDRGEQQEVIQVTVISAASSGDSATGSATMHKLKGDTSKEWTFIDRVLSAPYMNEAALLTGFSSAINNVASEVRKVSPSARLEVTCVTFHASILTGFNKNRKTWEANGFITSRGNRVKNKAAWKELFLLADQYDITFKRPVHGSTLMKACSSRAKMTLQEAV